MKSVYLLLIVFELYLLVSVYALSFLPTPWRNKFHERKYLNYGLLLTVLAISILGFFYSC